MGFLLSTLQFTRSSLVVTFRHNLTNLKKIFSPRSTHFSTKIHSVSNCFMLTFNVKNIYGSQKFKVGVNYHFFVIFSRTFMISIDYPMEKVWLFKHRQQNWFSLLEQLVHYYQHVIQHNQNNKNLKIISKFLLKYLNSLVSG